jgi:hypothetical protein
MISQILDHRFYRVEFSTLSMRIKMDGKKEQTKKGEVKKYPAVHIASD